MKDIIIRWCLVIMLVGIFYILLTELPEGTKQKSPREKIEDYKSRLIDSGIYYFGISEYYLDKWDPYIKNCDDSCLDSFYKYGDIGRNYCKKVDSIEVFILNKPQSK